MADRSGKVELLKHRVLQCLVLPAIVHLTAILAFALDAPIVVDLIRIVDIEIDMAVRRIAAAAVRTRSRPAAGIAAIETHTARAIERQAVPFAVRFRDRWCCRC